MNLVTDTVLISQHADLFVYVVRANYVEKHILKPVQKMLLENRLPNMTILINATDYKNKGYGYGYGEEVIKRPWWRRKIGDVI